MSMRLRLLSSEHVNASEHIPTELITPEVSSGGPLLVQALDP